jgi:hypothetical protein
MRAPDGSEQIIRAGAVIEKVDYDDFVSPLTAKECMDIVDGKVDEAALRESKEFVHASTQEPLVRT